MPAEVSILAVQNDRCEARYVDLGLLGRGGTAEVREVLDERMGRTVAKKTLRADQLLIPRARERFLREARITATLQHPGIPAVHDLGTEPDGRPWFTMKRVVGRTFRSIVDALHAPSAPERRPTLGRVVEALLRACDAVAYAHSRGVIHRDLKPDNLMVGRFGEVYVMDWGLAVQRDELVPAPAHWQELAILAGPIEEAPDTLPTRVDEEEGGVVGTLSYMPPEQAARSDMVTEKSDVYALGAVLYELMAGHPPFEGTAAEVWTALFSREPMPLQDMPPSPFRPPDLCNLCQHALRREAVDRPPDAGDFARRLREWIDGTQRETKARELVRQADELWSQVERERRAAMALRRDAERSLREVETFAPVSRKAPAWDLLDEAETREQNASISEVAWQQLLRSALNEVPDSPPVHERLADYYRARHEELERQRDRRAAAGIEVLLRSHDQGLHATYLEGTGRVEIESAPPGAKVSLKRLVMTARRLSPKAPSVQGTTPFAASLPAGSYLCSLEHPGFEPVRFPLDLPRGGRYEARRPGSRTIHPVTLIAEGSLGEDDVYVPAGWCTVGGDPSATDGLKRRRVWIDDFVIRRHPVTRGEYRAFLDALVDAGREAEALRHAPKPPPARLGGCVWKRDSEGHFQLGSEAGGTSDKHPITLVDWFDAMAYADWLATQTGHAWRLPVELEWEKAARGVDGRRLPWGDHFDHAFACVLHSLPEPTGAVTVDAFDDDVSPYGVRGLAGNVRDWCLDSWIPEGTPTIDDVVQITRPSDDDDGFRSVRGGAWTTVAERVRAASRFAAKPGDRLRGQGFRLARRLEASECASEPTRGPAP